MIKKENLFLKILKKEKFYNILYSAIKDFCEKNHELLLTKRKFFKSILSIDEIEDIEIDYKTVWIYDNESDTVNFDLVLKIAVEFVAVCGKHKDREAFDVDFWINANCLGSLDVGFDDFKVNAIEEYHEKRNLKTLSNDFVPYINKNEFDKYANEILKKYYPEAFEKLVKVDPVVLANRMGLEVIELSISEKQNILGQLYFDNASVSLYSGEDETYKDFYIKKNTIIIDPIAIKNTSYWTKSLTIIHECVHYYLHRKAFKFLKIINNNFAFIQCDLNGSISAKTSKEQKEWMERQANGIGLCVLMPKGPFSELADSLFELPRLNDELLSNLSSIIDFLSRTYNVTIYSARKRLIDLGFEEVSGVYNWVDGKYLRPYSFAKGSLNADETFSISVNDLTKILFKEKSKLFPYMAKDYFLFVENHVVLCLDKYLNKNQMGDLILSDYALSHMDECCVKFSTNCKYSNGFDYSAFSYNLCRDSSKEVEFDLEVVKKSLEIFNNPELSKRYAIHQKSIDEICSNIFNKPFYYILDYLMKYLDINTSELALESGLHTKTISRYLFPNKERGNKKPDKTTIVMILRALNLPSKIVDICLKQSGISLIVGNREDENLLFALKNMRGHSYRQVKKFLSDQKKTKDLEEINFV